MAPSQGTNPGTGPSQGPGPASGPGSPAVSDMTPQMMPGQAVSLPAGNNVVQVTAPGALMQTGGSDTIMSQHGAMTLNASGGNTVIYGGMDGDLVNEGQSCVFVGAPGGGVSTVNASPGGSDTVFAVTGIDYHGEHGDHSLFVGGSGAATVHCAPDQVLFAGMGGGVYTAGTSQLFFAGGGGADTVIGNAASCAFWGSDHERLTLMTGSASGTGANVVAFGADDQIDMTHNGGRNSVILWNAQIGSGGNASGFCGNTTLTASDAGHDVFVLFSGSQFGMASDGPHTITINNWQPGDILDLSFARDAAGNFLAGYTAADAASAQAQLASGSSFTLSDGSTVMFHGAKPTTVLHV